MAVCLLTGWNDLVHWAPLMKQHDLGMNCQTISYWLVVSTHLQNISQLGLSFPIYGKIKNVPNHQPDINGQINVVFSLPSLMTLSHWIRWRDLRHGFPAMVSASDFRFNQSNISIMSIICSIIPSFPEPITPIIRKSQCLSFPYRFHLSSVQNSSLISSYRLVYRLSFIGFWNNPQYMG